MNDLIRLLKRARPYWAWIAAGLGATLGIVFGDIAVPKLLEWVIDRVLGEHEYHMLLPYSLLIVGVVFIKGLFIFVRRYTMGYMGQRVIYDLRNTLYEHLHELSFSFYDRAQTGQLMQRLTQDVNTVRRFLGFGLVNIVLAVIRFFGVLAVMLYMNTTLTLIILTTLPFLIATIRQFGTRVRPAYRDIQQQQAELTAVLQENVTGVRVVRAFAQEEHEIDKFHEVNWGFLEKSIKAIRLWAFFFPMFNFITGIGTVAIIWYGGREVITGEMSLGALVAFNALLMSLVGPLRMLGWLLNLSNRAMASAERIFEVMDTQPEIAEPEASVRLTNLEGDVVLENVWFAYTNENGEKGPPVLKDINLHARPGETVALLGATGAGKSTLISLVPRFYDVDRGRVLIDGHDVRELNLKALRSQIGIVLQETFLFSASLRENIAYGRPGASQREIEEAARAARIHDFIVALPEGYDTEVGERGVGLSGGQKQRVAIARALLMDPRILILDDSTSSVDAETEHLIQQALRELMESRTTFVIAQRLSTIKSADTIVVLDQGRIVQRGTHDVLVGQPGIYREIYELQLKDQEELGEEYVRRALRRVVE